MPDLQNFQVTRGSAANVNVPTHVIEGTLQDGATILNDYRGDNAIRFPAILSTLTVDQQDAIVAEIAPTLIQMRAANGG